MYLTFPINITIGKLEISSHLIFEVLAFYWGFWYYVHLKRKTVDPISDHHRMILLIAATLGALIFSRFIGVLEHMDLFWHPPNLLFYLQTKTIVGGLLGGLLAVEVTKKIIGEKQSSGDLLTYPLILGICLGRIGCFLTGVQDSTVGNISDLPWAFDQGDGISRHPTALYEIVFLLLLWRFLLSLEAKINLKNGSRFKLFMVLYLAFRLFIEFIKPIIPFFLGFSVIQTVCLLGLAYYAVIICKGGLVANAKTLHVL